MKSRVALFLVLLILIAGTTTMAAEATEAEISQLITQLQATNFGQSMQAQNALVELGDQALPALSALLKRSNDSWNRVKVINVLGRIETPDAIKLLITGVEDRDQIVRDTVVSAAEKLNNEGKAFAAQHLMAYIIVDDLTTRTLAVELLGRLNVSGTEMALGLRDVVLANEGSTRSLALTELRKLKSEAAVVVDDLLALVDLSKTSQLAGSFELIETLTTIGNPSHEGIVEILNELILNPEFEIRQEGIWGMRRLGLASEAMMEPVMPLLAGNSADQQLAVEIIAQLAITQPDAVWFLAELLDDPTISDEIKDQTLAALTALVPKLEYHIDRGLVAVSTDEGVFISWRLLGTDPADTEFNLYRNGTKITAEPIVNSTNFFDESSDLTAVYAVESIMSNQETTISESVSVWENNYLSIPLDRPAHSETRVGELYQYHANDGSVGDLTGNGQYDIVLKWEPTNAKDNAQSGYTGNVYIDAYTLQGEKLWRIDLGPNIRAGAHYTQFMVYDLDNDGKAEVVMKTADGTVDGVGNVIGNPYADYVSNAGYILTGPEYLTVFDGATGAAISTIDYYPPRGNVSAWGDSYGNRVDRFLAGIAYLDGVTPSVIMARGYYTRSVLVAYNLVDGQLEEVWTFDSNQGMSAWTGQGNHQLSVADVDADGKQEIIYGAMTINNDGTGLYNTRLGHGDALHVANHDPDRPGLEVYAVHESYPHHAGMNLRDARTGEILWGIPTNHDVGRGVAANIDPNYRGSQAWGSRSQLLDIDGNVISNTVPAMNFTLWWDGDLQRELLDGTTISKWDWENQSIVTLLSSREIASNNGSKATPTLQADILGDWREEVIWRTNDSTELRIYTTTDLTEHRLYTLMHDPMYRVAIAWQNVAYNQPPHPSFYVGEEMEPQTYNPGLLKIFLEQYAQ